MNSRHTKEDVFGLALRYGVTIEKQIILVKAGITTLQDLAALDMHELSDILGVKYKAQPALGTLGALIMRARLAVGCITQIEHNAFLASDEMRRHRELLIKEALKNPVNRELS